MFGYSIFHSGVTLDCIRTETELAPTNKSMENNFRQIVQIIFFIQTGHT